ncbi:DUF5990 family protein [Micromonospora sp. NPDC049004]|uniref:DUF5990 family protein n=1 Tax=Micromonospora sp. NPDC049004 TaxID=3154348 RepID=UPI0033FDDB5E
MRIRIEGSDLPGRRADADADALRLGNVHVGIQQRTEVIDRVRADAATASWEFEVSSRDIDGALDVGGPYVHGRPGARFLYLSWGALTDDGFAMFRRAKLMFTDIPTELLRAAHESNALLVGALGLTDATGGPVCARVHPPAITWTVQ